MWLDSLLIILPFTINRICVNVNNAKLGSKFCQKRRKIAKVVKNIAKSGYSVHPFCRQQTMDLEACVKSTWIHTDTSKEGNVLPIILILFKFYNCN